MLCFLKRVLPFTLTLLVGLAIGGLFNLFGTKQAEQGVLRVGSDYAFVAGSGSGCRSQRMRAYAYDYRPARIISQGEAAYTAEARRNQTEGSVMLRVTLAADGTVSNIETITSLPYGLTEQAWKAAREIKFVPATRGGQPVDEVKTLTYYFNLN